MHGYTFFEGKIKPLLKTIVYEYGWQLYGKQFSNPMIPQKPKSILFLCKGNICRSPFAEKIAKAATADNSPSVRFGSAGIQVSSPKASPAEAIRAANEFGVDLSRHLSSRIDVNTMIQNDMIVVMETGQLDTVKRNYPKHKNKIFLLGLFDDFDKYELKGYLKYNIKDPYGYPLQTYIQCYKRLERCVLNLISQVDLGSNERN